MNRAALDLAARLESVRGDCACWLRAALLEACGRFEEAAGALRLLREKTAGEERALIMLASARNLLAAELLEQVWYPLAETCKSSASPRTLRNAARLLAQARKRAEAPFRRRCRIALLSSCHDRFPGADPARAVLRRRDRRGDLHRPLQSDTSRRSAIRIPAWRASGRR